MSEAMDDFMREGFLHYGEAILAIRRFQSELKQLLADAVSGLNEMNGVRFTGEPTFSLNAHEGYGAYVYVYVPVAIGDLEDRLDLGFWWGAPERPGVVAYGKPLWPKKAELEFLLATNPSKPVEACRLGGKAHLVVPFDPAQPAAAQFAPLIDALTRAVVVELSRPRSFADPSASG